MILSLEDTLKSFDCCMTANERKCDNCPQNKTCGPYVKTGIGNLRESVHYWLDTTRKMKEQPLSNHKKR